MKTEHYDIALANTQRHHSKSKTFSGKFAFRYAERIKEMIDAFDCQSMLDYGCGKGVQYVRPMDDGQMFDDYLGLRGAITKYDPGLPQFSTEPKGKFDIVVCTQVLGWIPSGDISWVVDKLYDYADKAVFIGERVRVPHKTINKEIEEHMPYRWTVEDYVQALKRSDRDIACWFQANRELIKVQ